MRFFALTLWLVLAYSSNADVWDDDEDEEESGAVVEDDSSSSDPPPPPVCEPRRGLNFERAPPVRKARSKRLSMCNQFTKSTCCQREHTDVLRMARAAMIYANFGASCLRWTDVVACSVCHPHVGIGTMHGICPGLCKQWFGACRGEYYGWGVDGSLTPCRQNALVCAPLDAIIRERKSGAKQLATPDALAYEFCAHMGFDVPNAAVEPSMAAGSTAAAAELRWPWEVDSEEEALPCYDGSVPKEVGVQEEELEGWVEPEFESAWGSGGGSGGAAAQLLAMQWGVAVLVLLAGVGYLRSCWRGAREDDDDNDDDGDDDDDDDDDDAAEKSMKKKVEQPAPTPAQLAAEARDKAFMAQMSSAPGK